MVTVKEVTSLLEEFAPLAYQAPYDNAGLIVGRPENLVSGVLLAVDVTEEVIAEAIEVGANLIVTHHPIVFHPLKRFNSKNFVERCVETAIRSDIALYACHTNLDSTPEGMSWRLAKILGVTPLEIMESTCSVENVGFGVVGTLSEPMPLGDYLEMVAWRLGISAMRHSRADMGRKISRVALCTGSGGSLIGVAKECGAELYITGDLKYNDFMEGSDELAIVDIGHFESEYCAIDLLFDILSKKMFNFAVRKSEASCNPVYYKGFENRN
ncbi:MAG: Nif3-like dinuclear metal center hexameric protein [Rikenellaceae bacterium]